jgi:glycyl-radical enzyme activating protein/glucokinase-like ROK family protein
MNSWVIGVDLGGTKIELGLVDPHNRIISRRRIATEPQRGPENVADRIAACVQELQRDLPAGAAVTALGICSPGPVDHETGTLIDPPNLAGLHNAPLRQLLAERLRIPVSLEHDAKAAALGEFHYGAGRGEQSMVFIVIGTGVGGAVISDAQLFRGQHNSAGEIGHVTLDREGELCSCGRRGCVETFLSGPWLARRYLRLLGDSSSQNLTAADVAARAAQGDPLARQVMTSAGEALGVAVGSMAMILNMDLFVVGGSVAKAGDLLLEPARRVLPLHTYRSVGCGVHLITSELGDDGPILGCAWLARQAQTDRKTIPTVAQPHANPARLLPSERTRLEQVEGVVFDVQRFSVHDGPGIRTNVFLKGCALRCQWCANPESQYPQPQLALSAQNCMNCGLFDEPCTSDWRAAVQTKITQDSYHERTEVCPTGAIRWIGARRTAGEVIAEVLRDKPFYGQTGGMTLTGGEPTFQPRMAEALLRLAKAENISTTLETAGHTRWQIFERLLPYLDLILFDIKHLDPEKHRTFTGVDNELILGNLSRLAAWGAPVQVRVPLIPGFNTCEADLRAIAEYVSKLDGLPPVIGLLPYHTLGRAKYRALGRDYPWQDHEPLSDEAIRSAADLIQSYDLQVTIGH